jgi:hypothetical protein
MPESDQRVSASPSRGDSGPPFSPKNRVNRLALGFRESRRGAPWVSVRRSFSAHHRGDKQPRYAASGLGASETVRKPFRPDRTGGAELA